MTKPKINTKYFTSFDNGHWHVWTMRNKYTSTNSGHRHKISKNFKSAFAGNTDHNHKLLLKEVK